MSEPEAFAGQFILKNYETHHQIHQPDTSLKSTWSILLPSMPNTMTNPRRWKRWQ